MVASDMETEDKKKDETQAPAKEAPRPFDWDRDDVVVLEDDGDSY